jgi:hypothetical protein
MKDFPMRSIVSLGTLCAMVLALSGCGLMQSAQQGMHEGFRKQFKTSFIESCTKSSGGLTKACTCIEDQLEKTHTDDELMKMAADSDATQKALADASAACGLKK